MLFRFKPRRGLSGIRFPDLPSTLNYYVVLFTVGRGSWLSFPAEWFWTDSAVSSAFPVILKCSGKVTFIVTLDWETFNSSLVSPTLWLSKIPQFPKEDIQPLGLGRRAKGLGQIHALIVMLGSWVTRGAKYQGKATRLKLWSHSTVRRVCCPPWLSAWQTG